MCVIASDFRCTVCFCNAFLLYLGIDSVNIYNLMPATYMCRAFNSLLVVICQMKRDHMLFVHLIFYFDLFNSNSEILMISHLTVRRSRPVCKCRRGVALSIGPNHTKWRKKLKRVNKNMCVCTCLCVYNTYCIILYIREKCKEI